jgi:hypothetical protein
MNNTLKVNRADDSNIVSKTSNNQATKAPNSRAERAFPEAKSELQALKGILKLKQQNHSKRPRNDYVGVCPYCFRWSLIHIGSGYWGYCPQHQIKWLLGENLDDEWKHESYASHMDNYQQLKDYKEVRAVIPKALNGVVDGIFYPASFDTPGEF